MTDDDMYPTIIEAAARALSDRPGLLRPWNDQSENAREWYRELARTAVAAVTPLIEAAYVRSRATIHVAAIRAAALEEAEQAVRQCSCLDEHGNILATRSVIAAIRALKPASPSPSAASA